MTESTRARIAAALTVTLIIVLLVAAIATVSTAAPVTDIPESINGMPLAVVRYDPTVSDLRVPPPPTFAQMRTHSAAVYVNFVPAGAQDAAGTPCYAWPTDAKTAVNYAASIWASLINSSVPTVIEACWADLGGDVLGYGGALDYFVDAGTMYPVALVNALSGTDLNGGDVEMIVTYNKNFDWYWGTDGNTPSNQVDLVSVVLHEVCHGLGFSGSMVVSGGRGYWGFGVYPEPAIYDRFTENGAGQALLDFPNGSPALAGQLTSDDVYFDGSNANAANGGSRPKLFAPSTWLQGSSYAHLDEVYNGTPNALMTYSLADGESLHSPGPVALGILRDLGWGMTQQAPDLNLSMELMDGPDFDPGDPVTFTLSIANIGAGPATSIVITDILSPDILAPAWSASPSLGEVSPRPGTTYVWDAGGLPDGALGIITVSGTIRAGLPADFAIINTASVSAAEQEASTDNNSATVIVGGKRVYLPVTIGKSQ